MPERFSPEERSRIMSLVRSKDTGPEMAVRSALHKRGFRFRVDVRAMAGRPDIVLRKYRSVVFVHGCLWHGHKCSRFRWPVRNSEYWRNKIERNAARDNAREEELRQSGWDVHIVWDCDLASELERLLDSMESKRTALESKQGEN